VATTTKPKGGLTLATRVFLLTAFLIVLAVGAAVVVTWVLGNGIANRAASESLSSSHRLLAASQRQRYDQLKLGSRVLAGDANFRALVAEAGKVGDSASIVNVLQERQGDLGFDFAIVTDPAGKVLARTDQLSAAGQDLAARPLIAEALRKTGEGAAGVWLEGNRLYDTVAVPMVQDFILQGLLVTGFAIGDERVRELQQTSGTDLVLLASGAAGPTVAASTLGPDLTAQVVPALRTQGAALREAFEGRRVSEQFRLELAGRPWLARLSPLLDAAGGSSGGSLILASLDRATASYRQIETVLVVVGLVSMLLAGALSYLLTRATMRPVGRLVAAAEAARQGDYDQKLGLERGDEVGRLGRAFDTLMRDLREKRDMETYMTELGRNLPTGGLAAEAAARPQAEKVALLAVELRGFSGPRVATDPDSTLERLARDVRRVASAVSRQRGRLQSVYGHRVLAVFDGDGRAFRALAAAAEATAALSQKESAFDESEPPAVALAVGSAVMGSVVVAEGSAPAVVGLPVQQLESLLREASPGDILLGREAFEELRPTFQQAGVEIAAQRGLLSPMPLYHLRAEIAARTTGVDVSAAPAADAVAGTLSGIAPGQLLGERFQILGVLGAGGMGVVYKARDRELDDLVALKMLKKEMATDPVLLDRLKSEIKLARKITHPNVLRTFDFGEVGGMPYISMEYVRGVTLRYLLDREGRLPYSAGLRLAKQLLAGLGAAHAQGVIHRDIKPENLILDPAGNAKLMDFGIARPTQRLTPGQTQAGWIVGTPEYLSPEQLEGKEADPRADIYACGVVFYEMFTGALPFSGDSPMAIIMAHLNEAPQPPTRHWKEMPPELERIILKCLERDRDRRYRGVDELERDLDALAV